MILQKNVLSINWENPSRIVYQFHVDLGWLTKQLVNRLDSSQVYIVEKIETVPCVECESCLNPFARLQSFGSVPCVTL